MATLNEILQKYVDSSYEELLAVANDSFMKLMPVFNEVADDGNGAKFIVPVMCASIAADNRFSTLEYKFIKDLLNSSLTYDDFMASVRLYSGEKGQELVDKLFDACGTDLKTELLSFCLCFMAIDETISKEETAFIKKLLA
ncbi:MAG: hypothetical protein IJ317_03765 [Clostridia bacterium]|nr:hypothetical protein [Clostridia bacterium]